ncbi:Mediator of RNA polymerase II transcription subunit 16 [Candida viswanathii]|uniref:Mediator of RNA polymerase II transcription subunit 16 n=1 Tax=Candida viswanathii TaxID=5486 RepID=A0A367YIU7_9ASCO|nr:Mediator of RNA polymerase II transcription subunit 16 [Candida viswanathii]
MDKELVNRHLLDVTRTSDLIAWSRNGFIAYIPPTPTSKSNMLLTYLENVNGVTWQLSKPLPINVKVDNSVNFLPQLSLVSWSTLSTDLAISDIYGNFYILLAGVRMLESKDTTSPSFELTSYNHMEMIYRDIINDDINSPVNPGALVIAYKWLNIEKTQVWNKPATRVNLDTPSNDGNSFIYAYGVNQHQAHGVCHPIPTKQAVLVLRKNGQLMLYYQGEHKVEYHKIFENLTEEFQIIKKASIGFTNDKKVIITTWDSLTNNINTYAVEINWGFLTESAKRQKVDAHYHTPKEAQKPPKLIIKKIHQMKPLECYHEGEKEGGHLDVTGLTSIDLISANPEQNSSLSILITYDSSVIYRYTLDTSVVSDVFTNLGLEKNAQCQGKESITVTLVDKMTRGGPIESISSGFLDYTFSILYKDGRVEVVDTRTFKIQNIEKEDTKPNHITSIFDIGFEVPKVEHVKPLIMAVSPNLTAVVYTELFADTLNLKLEMFKRTRNLGLLKGDLYTTAVGLAYCHALALYSSSGSDDLVVLMQIEAQRLRSSLAATDQKDVEAEVKKFIGTLTTECHKAINFQIDSYSKDAIDRLLSTNTSLQKLLSLLFILGEVQQNHKAADISLIVLHLKSTSLGIMFSLSNIYRQISKKKPSEDTLQDSINRGEYIVSLLGSFKWLIDLLAYLNQELLQLTYIKNNNLKNSKLTLKNSIAIPILMGKVPRLFLMYAITSMGRTHEILKKVLKELTDANKLFTPMKESLNRYFAICNTAPVTVNLFENFLRECDALCTKELATRFTSKEQALRFEQKLVCQGELPDEFLDVALSLLDRFTMNSSREMKVAELVLYPTEWLDIGVMRKKTWIDPSKILNDAPQKVILRWDFEGGHIDSLRKIYMDDDFARAAASNNGLRQCTRCRGISAVTDNNVFEVQTPAGLWTMLFQRNCLCGNPWITDLSI